MTVVETVVGMVKESGAKSVSVGYRDVGPGIEWSVEPEAVYHAASTMKVPVMMEVYRQEQIGRFTQDTSVEIRNSFTSIADGSTFAMLPEDDADPELYDMAEAPIRELVRRMIVRSSNLATNLLIDLVSPSATQTFMDDLGAPGLVVLRGVMDEAAFTRGLNNTVTARGLTHILAKLARREVVGPRESDAMLDVLLRQEFSEGIPAGLPAGTPVAHKTGWNSLAYHDAAVIDPHGPSPKVLVILTTGLGEMGPAGAFAATLTAEIWRAATA